MRQTKGQMGSQQRIWEKCQGQGQRRLKTGWKQHNRRDWDALGEGGGDVKKVDMRQVGKIINSAIGGQRERLMRFEHNMLEAERIDYTEILAPQWSNIQMIWCTVCTQSSFKFSQVWEFEDREWITVEELTSLCEMIFNHEPFSVFLSALRSGQSDQGQWTHSNIWWRSFNILAAASKMHTQKRNSSLCGAPSFVKERKKLIAYSFITLPFLHKHSRSLRCSYLCSISA